MENLLRPLGYTESLMHSIASNISMKFSFVDTLDIEKFHAAAIDHCNSEALSKSNVVQHSNREFFQLMVRETIPFEIERHEITDELIQNKLNMHFQTKTGNIDFVFSENNMELLVTCPHHVCDVTSILNLIAGTMQLYLNDGKAVINNMVCPDSIETALNIEREQGSLKKTEAKKTSHKAFTTISIKHSAMERLRKKYNTSGMANLMSSLIMHEMSNLYTLTELQRYLTIDLRRFFPIPQHTFVDYSIGVPQLLKGINLLPANEVLDKLIEFNKSSLRPHFLTSEGLKHKFYEHHTLAFSFIDTNKINFKQHITPLIQNIDAHCNAFYINKKTKLIFILMTKHGDNISLSAHFDRRNISENEISQIINAVLINH